MEIYYITFRFFGNILHHFLNPKETYYACIVNYLHKTMKAIGSKIFFAQDVTRYYLGLSRSQPIQSKKVYGLDENE